MLQYKDTVLTASWNGEVVDDEYGEEIKYKIVVMEDGKPESVIIQLDGKPYDPATLKSLLNKAEKVKKAAEEFKRI